jgi:hypothetical protein
VSLAGVRFPPAAFPFLLPMVIALAGSWFAAALAKERVILIAEVDGRRMLSSQAGRETRELRLDELASVSREAVGARQQLCLTDLRGLSITLPLGVWTNEERLLHELSDAAHRAGVSGGVGEPVPGRVRDWNRLLRIALVLGTLIPMVVLLNTQAASDITVVPVTPERMRAAAGETSTPYAAGRICDIYLVPADRPSEAAVRRLRIDLARRLPADICTTPSLVLPESVLDRGRSQVDGSLVLDASALPFRDIWPDRPAMTVAVTSHDMFTSGSPDLRFTFGLGFRFRDGLQSHAALSSGRMGTGEAAARRLETMALRYIGYYYFGLPFGADPTVALGPRLGGLTDLDRMRPQFSDPELTAEELRAARRSLLAGR